MTPKSTPLAARRIVILGLLLAAAGLAVVVLLATGSLGWGRSGDSGGGNGAGTHMSADLDGDLVPLSGAHTTHVVGASTFSRFHLLTPDEAQRPIRGEDDDKGIEAGKAAAIRAADLSARAQRKAHKLRSAARGFLKAANGARDAMWRRREEGCLVRAIGCYDQLGERMDMLAAMRRVHGLRVARRDGLGAARAQADMGSLYGELANFDHAIDHLNPAGEAFGRFGMRRLQAHAISSMALAYQRRAEYGPALDLLERARSLLASTRSARRKAYATNLLGNVYEDLGDPDRAATLYKEALALYGDEETVDKGDVLGNLGSVHFHNADYEEAIRFFEKAEKLFKKFGDAKGTANALFSRGRVRKVQGGYRTALDIYRQALDLQEASSPAAARTRCAMAETYLAMGRPDDALAEIDAALDAAADGAVRTVHVELLVVHALANLRKKKPQAAIEKIRRALDLLREVTAGLADEHVVGVREHRGWIFDAGLAVALRAKRVDLATEFLEHGRAGALLEAMGARGAQRGVSAELREMEALAAHRVARANRAYQEARGAGVMDTVRASRSELDKSRASYRTVMQRLQRASKRAASVFHPVPDSLASIRQSLGPHDVLVLYALLPFQAHALVITHEKGEVVWLGNTPDIRAACEALAIDDRDPSSGSVTAVQARLEAIKRQVIDPLQLPAGTKRLLLSPDGPLCYVPFPLVLHDTNLEVACLPSGTTLRLLAPERKRTGTRVLALGDPEYSIEHQGRSLQVYADGLPLKPLPATRAEVLAITGEKDMRLLGSYATVRGLTEVAGAHPRWDVIHLACHGLIDPRTPTLSALAITPDSEDDGFLTALEVYGMVLPTDLVVLSGCNTGRGRFMKGEGIVGLMRAFMCAGAPRVLVSLWKVDDDATRALMVSFHKHWRTHRLSAPSALRRAQAEVRAVPAWEHPRFWGAWVLWGLAE